MPRNRCAAAKLYQHSEIPAAASQLPAAASHSSQFNTQVSHANLLNNVIVHMQLKCIGNCAVPVGASASSAIPSRQARASYGTGRRSRALAGDTLQQVTTCGLTADMLQRVLCLNM